MSTTSISHSSIETVYFHLKTTCNTLNDKFETSEIAVPFYDFGSFLDHMIECQENSISDVKLTLATGKHRIAAYIKAVSADKIRINYTSLNLTRSSIVSSYSTVLDVDSNSNYNIDMLIDDELEGSDRKATYEPSTAHDRLVHDVEREFNNNAVNGTVQEIVSRIREHRYFSNSHKGISNLYDFLKFLVQTYNIKGTKRTIMCPIYSGYPELANGDTLTHDSEIYNILSFVANDLEPEKVFKSALKDHFNGLGIGAVAGSDTLVVGEGLLNTAIVHFVLNNNNIRTTGVSLNGSTGFAKFTAALAKCGVEKSQYKKILIVPDNDATIDDKNDGIRIAKNAAKKLLKLGYSVSVLDAYIGTTATTSANDKCDVFDAFSELGLDKFSSMVLNNYDFCGSLSEFSIQQKTKGFSKKHKAAIDDLLAENKGRYINWTTHQTVKDVAKSPLFGSVRALHRAICLHLNISYITHKEILEQPRVALDTVNYVDGRPTIDTKKEMFFGNDTTPILVKAPMGSGKTDNVIKPFYEQTNKQSLVVLPNIALTKQIVSHFKNLKVKHYKDSDGDIKGRVVTTVDSLGRFFTSDCDRAMILDEIQQIIGLFCTENRLPNKLSLIGQIKATIDNGQQFVGTSADIDDSTVVFFEKVFKIKPKIAIYGTRSDDNPNKDISTQFYKKITDFKAAQLEVTDNKEKILYVTDSLKQAETAKAFFQLRGYTVKVISSKTKDHTIYNPNGIDQEYDVIIVTPSASVGVSFTVTNRTVFAYYTGTIDTNSFVQLISRARKRNSIHVYERLLVDVDRNNKLKKQSAGADYAANNGRLSGVALDLLVARSEFKTINDLTVLEALLNQGYNPEFIDCSKSEYVDQVKSMGKLVKGQEHDNQVDELHRYQDYTDNLSDQQINDIIKDNGNEKANDEKKSAAILKKYESLSLQGIKALNEKWFGRISILSMELDDNDIIAKTLHDKQSSASSVICETDYLEISRIVKQIKSNYDNKLFDISDYTGIIAKHFESKETFTDFHSKVLNPLGIKVTFLHGALNYKDAKAGAIMKIMVALLKFTGYNVSKEVVISRFPDIRDISIKIAYDMYLDTLDIDTVYDAMTDLDDISDSDIVVDYNELTF